MTKPSSTEEDLRSRRTFMRSMVAGALTAGSFFAFGKGEMSWLEIDKRDIESPLWSGPPLRIGYFSDSHLTTDQAVAVSQQALAGLIALKPDVLFFGGDFVEDAWDGPRNKMPAAYAALRNCSIPAYAVLGNHDYATALPKAVMSAAENLGFQLLRNRVVEWRGVTIVGIDCMTFGLGDPTILRRFTDKKNVVSMIHEPDGAELTPPRSTALLLAGHSHGGQVCFPGGIPIHTPKGARKYSVGLYHDAPNQLFVSRGVGVTGLRLRLFCRPEASLITLRSPSS